MGVFGDGYEFKERRKEPGFFKGPKVGYSILFFQLTLLKRQTLGQRKLTILLWERESRIIRGKKSRWLVDALQFCLIHTNSITVSKTTRIGVTKPVRA